MATESITFKDKVILVTGSSSGMGAEMNLRFAKIGGLVVVHGRDSNKMQTTADKCEQIHPNRHKPLQIKADMTNDSDLRRVST